MVNGKVKQIAGRAAAGVLSAVLCVAVIPHELGSNTVNADSVKNRDNTYLGVSGISNPDTPDADKPWSGSYVYFGSYEEEPVKFRVLQKNSNAYTSKKALFLDSNATLFNRRFDDSSDAWEESEIREYLNGDFYSDSFSVIEKNCILTSTGNGGLTYASDSVEEYLYRKPVSVNDKVILLDAGDVMNPAYGYSYDGGYERKSDTWINWDVSEHPVTNRIKGGSASFWWMRSAFPLFGAYVSAVNDNGCLYDNFYNNPDYGVAPALNIDQESIIFSSVTGNNSKEFKLTLGDSNINIAVPDGQKTVFKAVDRRITVPYSVTGKNAGNATRISVLILNKEYKAGNANGAWIVYYDALNGEFGKSGSGTFTLPTSLDIDDWGINYYVYILAEDINGEKETDYATEPVLLDKPEVINEVITSANCTITKPHEGDKMDVNPVSDDPSKYEVQFDCWYVCSEPDYPTIKSTDTYKAGKTYAIRVYFIAKDGYEFDNNTKFTINGETYGKFTPNAPDRVGVEARFLTLTDTPYTGWVENGLRWQYFESGNPVTGWKQIGGIWYHFSESGSMQKNWKQIDGTWYYLGGNGAMRTGWQEISGTWYYFGENGAMRKSWQEISGKWYYFSGSGAMVTGWYKSGDVWYYFESSGAMITGWKEISGVYYYFKSNGAMASNEYCGGYWLDASGAWTYKYKASWKHDATGWWYGDDSGWYAKNRTLKIDGKDYNFNASGYCTNP